MFTSILFSFETLTLYKLKFQNCYLGLENKQPCHFLLNPALHKFLSGQVYFNLQQHGQNVNTFPPCLLLLLAVVVM